MQKLQKQFQQTIGPMMALNQSPEFKGVIFQIVCVVEIQFESAWTLTNINSAPLAMPNGPQFSCI